MATNDYVNIKGALSLIKRSKNFFAPIIEGITNSFEAINANKYPQDVLPFIRLNFYFSGLFNDSSKFEKLEITDNGIGFNDESYLRYITLLDKSKGHKNRGSGRLQFLHRFGEITVKSRFNADGKTKIRQFRSTPNSLSSNHELENSVTAEQPETTITFKNFDPRSTSESLDDITLEQVRDEIKNRFLLKLYLHKEKGLVIPSIEIRFFKNGIIDGQAVVSEKDIPEPIATGTINVFYKRSRNPNGSPIEWAVVKKHETFKWAHWKLPEDELNANALFLCSKDIAVQGLPFTKLKKTETLNGYRYLTAFYGDFLDQPGNVDDSVDHFRIPTRKEVEKEAIDNMFFDHTQERIFFDDIEEAIKEELPIIYPDLAERKKKQDDRAAYFAETHGIPLEIAHKAGIDISDSDEKIVEKIYKKQAEINSKSNLKIQELYNGLIKLTPTHPNYEDDIEAKAKQLLELIPNQNKNELARYVIRREMVTKILGLIINDQLQSQRKPKIKGERTDREGLIHDLVFKRRTTEALNDLWVLNEEFLHFEGCSDISLDKIILSDGSPLLRQDFNEDEEFARIKLDKRKSKRPDIFLFPSEGKCVLVEFKAHDVDLSDHLQQIVKYCNIIANFANKPITSFFCYLVGEVVEDIDLGGEFEETIYGDFVKPYTPIRSIHSGRDKIGIIYQEVIRLSNVFKRAEVRNKSFADKLGLRLEQIPLEPATSLVTSEANNSFEL